MELFNQNVKTLHFNGALILAMQPVEGDLELDLELHDKNGALIQGCLAFITAYVIESDPGDSLRLKMDKVYFSETKGFVGGKILKIDFLFDEDEKQANVTLEKYGLSGGEPEMYSLNIKCLMVKWMNRERD